MLSIPFLQDYFGRLMQVEIVTDAVDRLNYFATTYLLAMLAFALSCKQYFGSPIKCFTPKEFGGAWDQYTDDYCFIANSYHVAIDDELPADPSVRTDQISYYRWIPIVLALQAFFFYLPNYMWKSFQGHTALNLESYIKEAQAYNKLSGKDREEQIDILAQYFLSIVEVFEYPRSVYQFFRARSGRNAVHLYCFTKLLFVLNLFMQIYLVDLFLGQKYLSWGFANIMSVVMAEEFADETMFPRIIYCDFKVRRLGALHNYTVQCVIMLNMINEKIYLFLYIWFMALLLLTVVNFLFFMVSFFVPCFRKRLLPIISQRAIRGGMEHIQGDFNEYRDRFVEQKALPDGILLLYLVRQNVGARFAYELTAKILGRYTTKNVSTFKTFSDASVGDDTEHLILPQLHIEDETQPCNANAPRYDAASTLKLREPRSQNIELQELHQPGFKNRDRSLTDILPTAPSD